MKAITTINWRPIVVILFAVLIAIKWAFLVPIFQSPGEDFHADYVFDLYSAGRLVRGNEAPLVACSHPFVHYLLSRTDAEVVKYNQFIKMPVGYGTKSFFDKLDAEAPDKPLPAEGNPVMMAVYPFGYYAMAALWLRLISICRHSLSFLFFGTRLFSVILLACGLTFSYLTTRQLGLRHWQALLILMAISFFPLVLFVGSYIQPDNLSFAALSLCFFLALRWRNSLNSAYLVILSLAMALLFLAKYHFFCCASVAIIGMIIARAVRARFSGKKITTLLALLSIPSVIASLTQLWVSWQCSLPPIDSRHWHWFAVDTEFKRVLGLGEQLLISHVWSALCDLCRSNYSVDGATFISFWGKFGWLDTPLVIVSQPVNDLLRWLIQAISKIIILMTLASIVKVTITLQKLTDGGRWRDAFYIAFSNPVINTYFLFLLFMFLLNIAFYPSFAGQGRHWFPLILPIFLTASYFAPRVFPSKTVRKQIFLLITGSLIIYSLIADFYAFDCIYKRYYVKDYEQKVDLQTLVSVPPCAFYCVDQIDYIDKYPSFDRHAAHNANFIAVPAGAKIHISGWAIDLPAHSLAAAVLLAVDHNQTYQTIYGLENASAVSILKDERYRRSGFAIVMPTEGLSAGLHYLTIKVVSKDRRLLYPTEHDIKLVIEPK